MFRPISCYVLVQQELSMLQKWHLKLIMWHLMIKHFGNTICSKAYFLQLLMLPNWKNANDNIWYHIVSCDFVYTSGYSNTLHSVSDISTDVQYAVLQIFKYVSLKQCHCKYMKIVFYNYLYAFSSQELECQQKQTQTRFFLIHIRCYNLKTKMVTLQQKTHFYLKMNYISPMASEKAIFYSYFQRNFPE